LIPELEQARLPDHLGAGSFLVRRHQVRAGTTIDFSETLQ
jgi:hypothetical protein